MRKYNPILTIAGCDPSGGAGVLADLKAFAAIGCYGLSVLTVLTAQNTVGVQAIHPVPKDFIAKQLDSVLSDITPSAVKIGMLLNKEIIEVVAHKIHQYSLNNIVLDPVMVASTGKVLLEQDAVESLKKLLIPLADITTPNIPEAKVLVGDMPKKDMAKAIQKLGTHNVLVKGGHDKGDKCEDILLCKDQEYITTYPKINTKNTHGTGCTLSAAIATYLGEGYDIYESYILARRYMQKAIESGAKYQLGKGRGPVNHLVKIKIT